jgi:hypothetical protein
MHMAENKVPTKHLKMSLKVLKTPEMCMSIFQYIKGPPALPVPPPFGLKLQKPLFFNRVCVAWISIPVICVIMHSPIVAYCPIVI